MENVIIKFVADTEGLQPAIKQLQLMGKITDEDAAKFEKINAEQREFIQGLNKSTTEMGKLNSEVDQLAATVAGGAISKAADDLKKSSDEATKATKQFTSLKAELRALKAEIARGEMGAKEMRAATLRAAELEDRIGDINERVRGLASDTKRLDAVVTAFRGIAAGISVATGAAALFGSENKELEKTLMKVQGAMALLQGVQELATIATGNSALKTMVLDGAQKAVAVSARVMGISVAQATAVMTAGISVVVAAVAYLVSELMTASEETNRVTDEMLEKQKEQLSFQEYITNKKIALIKDGKKRELVELKLAEDREIAQLDDKLRRGIISGEQYEETFKLIRLKGAQDREKIEDEYAKKDLEAKKSHGKKVVAIRQKTITELLDIELQYQRDMDAINDRMLSEIMKLQTDELKAQREIDAENAKWQQEEIDKALQRDADAAEQKKNIEKQKAEEIRRINQELQDAIVKASIDAGIEIANALFDINNNRRAEEFNNEINFLNTQKDSELNNLELTEAQKLKINQRYALQEKRIKQEAARAQYNADLAQASINVALAISNALATIPPPANIPAAAAAGIAAGAQVAIIAAQGPPKFAKGVERLIGQGTSTSDDIWAKLSMGERVVPTDVNNDYFAALSAMHNRKVDPSLANNIMSALSNGNYEIAAEFVAKSSEKTNLVDYERLGQVFERGKNNVNIIMDEKGFIKYVSTKNGKTEYRNQKLRFRA